MEPLLRPNWHIAIVHFPVALVLLGSVIELFSFLGWRRRSLRWGGRWMLLFGAILAVPTAFTGIYALSQEVPNTGLAGLTNQVAADVLWNHLVTQSIATALAMLTVVTWIAMSDFWRDRLSLFFKTSLLVTCGLLSFGDHLGGESVYGHGIGVDVNRAPATMPTVAQLKSLDTWAGLWPPLQTHVLFAGLATAVACVTLGLAIRATGQAGTDELAFDPTARIAAAFAEPGDYVNSPVGAIGLELSPNHTPPVGAAKFWLLGSLLFIVTAVLGWWTVANLNPETFDLKAFWRHVSAPFDGDPKITRLLAHLVVGGVLVVDTLILALLARFARHRTVLLLLFSLPLVLALAAQLWLGILLILNGPGGPVTRFN